MKKEKGILKKILGTFAALAMTIGVAGASATSVLAADGSITIHAPKDADPNSERTYQIYKVFDAESIQEGSGESAVRNARYTVLEGKTGVPDVAAQFTAESKTIDLTTDPHFVLDTAGNVYYGTEKAEAVTSGDGKTTALTVYDAASASSGATRNINFLSSNNLTTEAVAAIKAYLGSNPTPTATATGTGTGDAIVSSIDDGYYYITTTTGSAVTITTNTPGAEVDDKSETPTLKKNIILVRQINDDGTLALATSTTFHAGSVNNGENSDKAIAQIGSAVTYSIRVNFGKDITNIKLHDKIGIGLGKMPNSTLDVKFYQLSTTPGQADGTVTLPSGTQWWKYREQAYKDATTKPTGDAYANLELGAPDDSDSLTIYFTDGISSHADYAVVTYTLQVTSDALQQGSPAENTAKVTYGTNNTPTEEKHTQVYNAKLTVIKTNGSGEPLPDATFKLFRTVAGSQGTNEKQYYKYDSATHKVSWVSENEATSYTTTSSEGGNVLNFVGLADGDYTLTETSWPRGYNKAADETFSIKGADTKIPNADNTQTEDATVFTNDNLVKSRTVVNNQGSLLPSTGGIGTTIFYVAGIALIAGAAVLLVSRKRRNA